MGQKINPTGYRVGISKDWSSRWYADKKSYSKMALEDFKIRAFLTKKLAEAGLREVEIERSVNDVSITVRVSKPGLVIGKGGSGIETLEKELKTFVSSKLKITAEEVKTPETDAQLVAQYIARQLKRRVIPRRVAIAAIASAKDRGAKGIKIRLSGLLSGGNSIARSEVYKEGPVPLQTLRSDIDYCQYDCHMLYGTIGIKVWIYKGEKTL